MTGGGRRRVPWRVVVVDDEPHGREAIRLALEEESDFEVVGEAEDGEEAVAAVRRDVPDLLFLDVRMPRQDGFQVLDALETEARPHIVFVTAYDEYALRAFEQHAVDYLLKPFDDDRFAAMLDHVRRRLRESESDPRALVAAVLEELAAGGGSHEAGERAPEPSGEGGYASRLMVRDGEHIRFVPVSDIDWLEADGNYVVLRKGGDAHRIRTTMNLLEARLDPSTFVRVHRSAILNLDKLREVQPWFSGDYLAILRDGTQVRVSRRYRDRLLRDAL